MNNSITRDPTVALEALLRIKKSVVSQASSSSASNVQFSSQYSSINNVQSWKPTFAYGQLSTTNSRLPSYNVNEQLRPTPNPLNNQNISMPLLTRDSTKTEEDNIKPAHLMSRNNLNGMNLQGKAIRKDEIEAALKSKPQRGRKRENLSGLERLELTRTRNREHAKNTRIRKKARYEDLIEKENNYFELKRETDNKNIVLSKIMKFFEARTVLLNKKLTMDSESSWDISTEKVPEVDKSSTLSEDKSVATKSIHNQMTEDASSFELESFPSFHHKPGGGGHEVQIFDVGIVNQLKAKIRNNASLSLFFVVEKDGIALSANNTGFVQFTLRISSRITGEDRQVNDISTGVIQFHFEGDSKKITSMKQITTPNFLLSLDVISAREATNSESCSFREGTAYPSVVSLNENP